MEKKSQKCDIHSVRHGTRSGGARRTENWTTFLNRQTDSFRYESNAERGRNSREKAAVLACAVRLSLLDTTSRVDRHRDTTKRGAEYAQTRRDTAREKTDALTSGDAGSAVGRFLPSIVVPCQMRGEITSKNPTRYPSTASFPPSQAFLTAKSGAQVTDENVHNGRKGGRERLLLQQERCITSLRDLILSDE